MHQVLRRPSVAEVLLLAVAGALPPAGAAAAEKIISLGSLLAEMADPNATARLPDPPYRCLQASSYNRESVHRDRPGWFADSDGTGFIRTEEIGGRTEWVILEREGPGCIAKMWTPYFYYSLEDRRGPDIRIYLDGERTPVISENFIALVTGRGSFPPPFAALTARAGNSCMPVPFAKGCKVTLTARPFYFIINDRAYPAGTPVETFRKEGLAANAREVAGSGKALGQGAPAFPSPAVEARAELAPAAARRIDLPPGPAAIDGLSVRLTSQFRDSGSHLRSTVMKIACDGEETVWCPVGDLFCSADAIHPFRTFRREVTADGTMTCRWPMPYRASARIEIENLGADPVTVDARVGISPWTWDDRSLLFHASWRPDELLPGTPFRDWTFVDVRGRGVLVGDAWTVLNPTQGWWGEGDEKIYVDGAWEAGFPTHFGTGTEDYYGWAGGEVPTREDEFDGPFLANVRVGGLDGGRARGFNICARERALDAVPFDERLRFDMEISPGTDQRRPTDFMGYSAVTFWYARPGARHDRPPSPEAARRPILSLADIDAAARRAGAAAAMVDGGIEFELLRPSSTSPGLAGGPQRPADGFRPEQWSGERHFFIESRKAGDFVEFAITEQFLRRRLKLRVTTSYDFGVARISVNGRVTVERLDLFSEGPTVKEVDLGIHEPGENRFVIRCELVEAGARSRGARTFMGLDRIVVEPIPGK